MTYTQNKSKKIQKNKNICTIYFLFRQLSLSLSSNFLFGLQQFFVPPISAMPLPPFFFLRNDMCTSFFQQILNDKLLLVVIVGLKK